MRNECFGVEGAEVCAREQTRPRIALITPRLVEVTRVWKVHKPRGAKSYGGTHDKKKKT